MLRSRRDWPPPQEYEHSDHCDQPDQTQLTGQGERLHVRSSFSEGQAMPPYAADTSTERTRCCTPSPPHEREQAFHAVNAVTAQLMGQEWVLHCLCSTRGGQLFPPCRMLRAISRRRLCEPTPHVAEQVDHTTGHADTAQSTGQAESLQLCGCLRKGQTWPPFLEVVVMVRVRSWVPLPQVLSHTDQGVQPLTSQ